MSRTEAVDALYQDMAARHRSRFRSIQVGFRSLVIFDAFLMRYRRSSRSSRSRRPTTSAVPTSSSSSPRTSSSLFPTASTRATPRRSSRRTGPPLSSKRFHGRGAACGSLTLGLWTSRAQGCSYNIMVVAPKMNESPTTEVKDERDLNGIQVLLFIASGKIESCQSLDLPKRASTVFAPIVSTGVHQGYAAGALVSRVSVNFGGLFSMKERTPSVLSLRRVSRLPLQRRDDALLAAEKFVKNFRIEQVLLLSAPFVPPHQIPHQSCADGAGVLRDLVCNFQCSSFHVFAPFAHFAKQWSPDFVISFVSGSRCCNMHCPSKANEPREKI